MKMMLCMAIQLKTRIIRIYRDEDDIKNEILQVDEIELFAVSVMFHPS